MTIANINERVSKKTHKFGIDVPNSIKNAKKLDVKNGDNLLCGDTAKEKYNILVAFNILGENESSPPGWTKSSVHWMLDIKIKFARKESWVNDRHQNPDPETSSYAGVVSREIIHILITYSMLHKVDAIADDI